MPQTRFANFGSAVTRRALLGAAAGCLVLGLAACSGMGLPTDSLGDAPAQPNGPPQASTTIGTGHVKVGLILPLSAAGNAGLAAQSMKNAAELAISEFNNPDIQLLLKDDGGTTQGAQQAAQQALDEGAEIILGPLFAHTVGTVGQIARNRGVPVVAFSTDSNVATRGVYLLSFLPESDVDRIVGYAVSQGKRSFVAMLPDSAYGTVVEAAFKQSVARRGGRIIALERYGSDPGKMQEPAKAIAEAAGRADALFLPDNADGIIAAVQALTASGVNLKRLQILGTGLWADDPRVLAEPSLQGGWYAAPDSVGFQAFAGRYRSRYGQDPVRTATLSYDAVALVAALVKTQGGQRFSDEVLANPSGFAGVDGVFRFRHDGTNERGLAVLKVTPSGSQVIAPAPKTFGSGT